VESSGDPCTAGEAASLTATVGHGTGPFTYLWSTGATTPSISAIEPEQLYTVTVTDGNGCAVTAQGFYHPSFFSQRLTISGPTATNCDSTPIVLRVDDPDPNFTYVWTTATDTLTGDSILTTRGGHFLVTGEQTDNPSCRVFGSFSVTNVFFSADELSIVSVGDNCDSALCLVVVDGDGNYLFGQGLVTWSSPNTDDFIQDFGFACVAEPGLYRATIATPCDTITLSFGIKSFPECTDLCGTVIMDSDGDCNPDAVTPDWHTIGILLTNDSTNISYLVSPDGDGNFCAPVPVGSYQMRSLGGGMMISTDCAVVETRMTVSPVPDANMELYAGPAFQAEETTTSVSDGRELSALQLTVFPNPSSGDLRLDLREAVLTPTDVLTLYDGLGRLVERTTVAALPQPWQPRGVSPGMYQLVLTDQNSRFRARASVIFQ
ncbi:MAG: hypothetical protein AAFZ52_07335, partial [Bacteroidota bacterium]